MFSSVSFQMVLIILAGYIIGFFIDKNLNNINGFYSTILAIVTIPFAIYFFYNKIK
ncbi:MAG: AtpZ/AtpI family protein [Flavobacteriales bacterium]